MVQHLNSGRLNLSLLRDVARSDLFSLLDSIDGTKAMVWDPKLIAPLGLISDYNALKEHRIIQMFELRAGQLPVVNAQHLIYFIRPVLSFIDIIADNVKQETNQKTPNFNFHIIFVPQKCILCEKKLEALGVYGDFVSINEYSPDFYVLDSDVISIEWPLSFKECHLEMDYSSLYQLARSLMTLQCAYGIIPTVFGIGRMSKIVYDIMTKMKAELAAIESNVMSSIDQLILIDRSVDLLSPMLTQLTYEGLLDEFYGINQTVIRLPPEKFVANADSDSPAAAAGTSRSIEPPTEVKRFYLNSEDQLFKKLRDLYYLSIGPALRSSAKSLAAQFDERKSAKTVREIKQFVEKIPYLQKLKNLQANHTSMAELIREFTDREEFHDMLFCENELLNCFETDTINPFIETCISRSVDIVRVIRLIAVQSFCANGLKQKTLDFYKREILQTYGYEHMLTLNVLEKCGIIRLANGYGLSYSGLRTRFKLTRSGKDSGTAAVAANNSDPAVAEDVNHGHVHDTYVPLSTRLVQHIDQFGFRSFNDTFSRHVKPEPDVPNQYMVFEAYQSTGGGGAGTRRRRNSDSNSMQSTSETNDKLVLVLFIGGCTFSEISSLRLLAHKEGVNSDFIVGTTSIINGKSFLRSMAETLNSSSSLSSS